MKLFSILLFIFVVVSAKAFAAAPGACFSPLTDPNISAILKPEARYNEDANSIRRLHELIWSHRDTIDPRLVYYRILGESRGQSEAKSGSGAYGLFQFTDPNIKRRLRAKIAQNPKESPRYIQVKFYFDEYVRPALNSANAGAGCSINRKAKAVITKKWNSYSNLEKTAYLGMNDCSPKGLATERRRCEISGQYKEIACPFAKNTIRALPDLPLCPTLEPTARTTPIKANGRSSVR